jgi:hypothetical protein
MTRRSLAAGLCLAVWGAAVGAVGQDPFKPAAPAPRWESCEELHDTYLRRFQDSEGFGLSRMMRAPMLDRSGVLDTGREQYTLDRIELIGLLQQPQPVVYTPSFHTSRPDPAHRSRALTPFEAKALSGFRAGRDIAVESNKDTGAMTGCVGAVRATTTCLRCHEDAKAGDLLGAFSYALSRTLAPPGGVRGG